MSELRQLPSVDQLISSKDMTDYISLYGRSLTVDAVRRVLNTFRSNHRPGDAVPTEPALISEVGEQLAAWTANTLQDVINATGVILHTNLGRAPLSSAALQAMSESASAYSSLEFDIDKGRRGSRSIHAEEHLKQPTRA